MGFFCTKGQVTPKSIVRSGRNSNTSKILCLHMLSASFIKIRLKLNKKAMLRTRSIWYFCHSRVSNSEMNSPPDNIFSIKVYGKNFHHSRASYSKVNGPIWPKIKLVRDFMDVLVTCKYSMRNIRSKMKSLLVGHFSIISLWELIVCHSRASNSNMNIPIWPKFELGDFMPVLVTCKFVEDPIKIEGTIDRTVKYELFWHSRADNS